MPPSIIYEFQCEKIRKIIEQIKADIKENVEIQMREEGADGPDAQSDWYNIAMVSLEELRPLLCHFEEYLALEEQYRAFIESSILPSQGVEQMMASMEDVENRLETLIGTAKYYEY